MKETRWNTIEYSPPYLPADARPVLTDKQPRIINGPSYDWYCTSSKTLRKRPGSIPFSTEISGGLIKKLWLYETLPVTGTDPLPYAYLIASVRSNSTNRYSLYSQRYDASGFSAVTALRESNESEKVHQITFSKGLAYVKGFPRSSTSEKYGTIILDGSSGSIVVRPWGMVPPTTPARLTGATTRLTASVTATATTFNIVSDAAFPATPFDFWIGYEKCTATAKGGTTFTVTRAVGGTEAQAHDDDEVILYRDWTASDHKIDVNLGWKYVYCYVSVTGQVSCRSDVEYNPDLMPSNTGPFFDLIPKMYIPGQADTTNIPYIDVYRSTDGGGLFAFLKRIDNTGAGNITFEDKYFGTGASSTTFADPVPDDKLDVTRVAPSLTSNSPPPSVVPPLVNGTDTPSKSCYSMCTFASRIWYGVDHYLFFSSREETRAGVGEECFPSGNLGNFFIFDAAVVAVAATTDSLYVGTTKDIYRLTGSTLDTFSFTKIASDIGVYTGNNSIQSFRNNVAVITSDFQVAIVSGNDVEMISDPLGWSLLAFYATSSAPDIEYYRDVDQEWLVVGITSKDTGTGDSVGKLWVYDINKSKEYGRPFWNTTWNVPASAMGAFRSVRRALTGFFWATGDSVIGTTFVNQMTLNTGNANYLIHNDYISSPSTGLATASPFFSNLIIAPAACPSGFNLNQVNEPRRDTRFYSAMITYKGNSTSVYDYPTAYISQDQVGTLITPVTADPPRIQIGTGGSEQYRTYEYLFDYESNLILLSVALSNNSKDVEIYQIFLTFDAKANP